MDKRQPRNVESIVFPHIGSVRAAPELATGVEVLDAAGEIIDPICEFLHELMSNGSSKQTTRSYALALLRWWRFLAAIDLDWERVTRAEFTDFIIWMRTTTPTHGGAVAGSPGYAPRTINHACAVIGGFYEFHSRNGGGPDRNPTRSDSERQYARHNPMTRFSHNRRLVGRQKVPRAAPRSIPDNAIDGVFTGLRHHRDRALVSLYLSTGARAVELLTLLGDGIDFGNNRIRVERKGTRLEQWLPASPDAMVWLRLYLGDRRLSAGEPVWLTLREPLRPLSYAACRQVFIRAQEELGTAYTLHQLRHTAAYRMMEDPNVSITDVQWILGHSYLSSTQIYTQARPEDVLARMAEHQRRPRAELPTIPAVGYDSGTLATLFGPPA